MGLILKAILSCFRKQFKVACILIIFYCTIRCSNKVKTDIPVFVVPWKNYSEMYLSEIAKSINEVQLETIKGSFLGSVSQVEYFNEKLYVRDINGRVLIFDNKGNFLGELGGIGDGPGEYSMAYTISIDEESGLIYLGSKNKIIVYSKNDEFLREERIPFWVSYLNVLNGEPIVIAERNFIPMEKGYLTQTIIFKFNKSLELTDSLIFRNVILKDKSIYGTSIQNYISKNSNGFFFYAPVFSPENLLRDTLYQFKDDFFVPSLKLQFEHAHLNELGKKAVQIFSINDASSYLVCLYKIENEIIFFLYDKEKEFGYNLKEGVLDEDGTPLLLLPLNLDKNIFFYVKSAEFIDSRTEELNPIIGIVELN
jgi:hypothetical protein